MNILMRPSVYLPAYLNLDFVIISMFFSVCISLSYFDTHTQSYLHILMYVLMHMLCRFMHTKCKYHLPQSRTYIHAPTIPYTEPVKLP